MNADNQQNTPKESHPSQAPIYNVSGDLIQGDKVGNDKVVGDKVAGNKVSKASQPPIIDKTADDQTANQGKKKTVALGISIFAIMIVIALGIAFWQINPYQSDKNFNFQVRVQDHITSDPIPNAQITLDIAGDDVPKIEFADSNGLAVFSIASNLNDSVTNLTVNTDNYPIKHQIIQVSSGQRPLIVTLENKP